jgi:hypothetical protein
MPFVWAVGSIVGPTIAGLTANSPIFPGLPYLLPNLICAAILFVSIVIGYLFLEETLTVKETPKNTDDVSATSTLIDTLEDELLVETHSNAKSYGTLVRVNLEDGTSLPKAAPETSINGSSLVEDPPNIFSKRVIMLVLGLGIYLFHTMAYDHLLPIFLQDKRYPDATTQSLPVFSIPGGLDMTIKDVGIIMSGNGIIALAMQGILFPLLTDFLGVWHTFLLVTILHPIAYFIVPYTAFLPERLLFPGIYLCLAIRNLFSIPAYPLFLILIKEAGNAKYMGKINGLAASIGAFARCASPPIAGVLYGLGTQIGFTGIAWWAVGISAAIGTVQIFWIKREAVMVLTRQSLHENIVEACPKKSVEVSVVAIDTDDDS